MTRNLNVQPLGADGWDSSLSHIEKDMQGRPLNVHKLMAHHPALLKAWWDFRNYSVLGGELGRRKCELLILRVAVHMKSWYEWGSHVERSLACGLTLEEIERVKQGGDAPGWDCSEAQLLNAVDELLETRKLSEKSQAGLREHFSIRQIMDIIAIHGMYIILGCMINTWGLELDFHIEKKLPAGVTRENFESQYPRGA